MDGSLFSMLWMIWACTGEPPDSPPGPDDSSVQVDSTPAVDSTVPDEPVEEVPAAVALELSHSHGFYEEPFALTGSSGLADASILYTTDGRDPQEHGQELSGLEITGTTPLRVAVVVAGEVVHEEARTFLFAEQVIDQQAPEDWPEQWWVEHSTGPYGSDYEMDPQVTGDPDYAEEFPAVFHRAPVLALTLPPEELFDIDDGIHENAQEHGVAWERAAFAEWFSDEDPEGFTVACGLRIQGGAGRRPDRAHKKSFRLLFKKDYGPGKLDYPVFEEGEVQRFDTLVLRARYNRAWTHYDANGRAKAAYIREQLGTELQRDMGHLAVRTRYVHLFINGMYWGIYLVQERPDANFLSSHLGGEPEDYDALNSGEVTDGDDEAWNELIEHIEAGVSSDEDYAWFGEHVEMENYTDYMLLQIFLGNVDWPEKNYYAGRSRLDGRFLHFMWDAELTMTETTRDVIPDMQEGVPGQLFDALREHEEYRLYFADRSHHYLFNEGLLSEEALTERWYALAATVEGLVVAESARWGDNVRDVREDPEGELYTKAHWDYEIERTVDIYWPKRTERVLAMWVDYELYPSLDAPEWKVCTEGSCTRQHGGELVEGQELKLSGSGSAEVWYTLDGSDPREPGGEVAEGAIAYTGEFAPTSDSFTATARRRSSNGTWSASSVADFERN